MQARGQSSTTRGLSSDGAAGTANGFTRLALGQKICQHLAVSYPLAGLKVLDFSRVVAGPFATRMLADLGADVVKVEPPDGDLLRTWGDKTDGLSGYFNQQNAGKRDICVDLKADGASTLLLSLAKEADLIIENYRPGVMERFGLGYEACSNANPAIIYLSISGFGQTSSWKHRPAYAPIIHAETGLLDRQSKADQAPPSNPVLSIADTNAALHGLVGLLSALWMREKTGTGQHIDLSMMAAMLATDDYTHWALDKTPFRPLGGQVRATGYGHIMISGDLRTTWYQLNTAGLVEDGLPIQASVPDKIAARDAALDQWFLEFNEEHVLQTKLDSLNIAWGRVQNAENVFDTEIAQELELDASVEFPSGPRRIAQSPYRFSNADSGIRFRSPYRGEHNEQVLEDWLGYSKSELAGLVEDGVLLAQEIPASSDQPSPNQPGDTE